MRKAQRSGRWAFLAGVISPGFFCVQLLGLVPSTRLASGALCLIALGTKTSAESRIVSVQCERNKVSPTVRPVVSHNTGPDVAQHADGVTVQHAEPEPYAVCLGVVRLGVIPVCALCLLGVGGAA
jgi:hypothetical protein